MYNKNNNHTYRKKKHVFMSFFIAIHIFRLYEMHYFNHQRNGDIHFSCMLHNSLELF